MRISNLKFLWLGYALAWPVSQSLAETPAEEAARMIRQAQQSSREEGQSSRGDVSQTQRATQLLAQARATQGNTPGDSAEQARLDAAAGRLNNALGNASPEAKVLIAQSSSAPAMRAPSADKVVPAEAVSIADVASAKPEPMRATPLEPEKRKDDGKTTTITASGAAFFDSKESIGVFTDDVVVNDPQFHITCDVLEVFMKKGSVDGKPAAQPAPAVDPNAPRPLPGEGPGSGGFKDSGVDKAIAKGRKVVIQKVSDTGEAQIGVCRHATYDGKTGDIILKDWPQVQDGSRTVTATERSTVMTLKQNGQFEAVGRYRTVLGKEEESKGGSVSVPAPGAAPAPAAAPGN